MHPLGTWGKHVNQVHSTTHLGSNAPSPPQQSVPRPLAVRLVVQITAVAAAEATRVLVQDRHTLPATQLGTEEPRPPTPVSARCIGNIEDFLRHCAAKVGDRDQIWRCQREQGRHRYVGTAIVPAVKHFAAGNSADVAEKFADIDCNAGVSCWTWAIHPLWPQIARNLVRCRNH